MKKEKMNYSKQRYFLTISLVLLICLSIVAILLDIRFKLNTNAILSLSNVLITTVSVVLALWVSCYLLYFELFKDRYPSKLLQDRYLPQMKYNFTGLVFAFLLGCLILVLDYSDITQLFFCLYSLFIILKVIINIFGVNKSFMHNSYINSICEAVEKDLENRNSKSLKTSIDDIRHILDESIVKEEFFVTQNITKRLGEVFRSFLENSIKISESGEGADEIVTCFERIVKVNIYLLRSCKKLRSDLLKREIILQQEENLRFCIDNLQYEWFKKYFIAYNRLTRDALRNQDEAYVDFLYSAYVDLLDKLIKDNKKDLYMFSLGELLAMNTSVMFMYKNMNVSHFSRILATSVISCIDCENEEMFQLTMQSFSTFVIHISRAKDAFDAAKGYCALVFNELFNKDKKKAVDFFLMVCERSYASDVDASLIEFKFYCIGELVKESSAIDATSLKEINKQHISTVIDIIQMKEKYDGLLLLPDYEKQIFDMQYDLGKIKEIISSVITLFNYCIANDNVSFYYSLLKRLNLILGKTESRNKDVQIDLFDIYLWLINRTRDLVNKQFLEMSFYMLEESIQDLDKKREISIGFCNHILITLGSSATCKMANSNDVVVKIIELLYSFIEEESKLSIVANNIENKKLLARILYNVGTSCIENDFEDGLRKTSNAIGWFIISSIKDTTHDLTNYLIARANELYTISRGMEVSEKSCTFILTLFTTVGTFCCKEFRYERFIPNILACIADEKEERVKTALSLRTGENDTWEDLLDKRTSELTSKFIQKFKEQKKNKH